MSHPLPLLSPWSRIFSIFSDFFDARPTEHLSANQLAINWLATYLPLVLLSTLFFSDSSPASLSSESSSNSSPVTATELLVNSSVELQSSSSLHIT